MELLLAMHFDHRDYGVRTGSCMEALFTMYCGYRASGLLWEAKK